MMKKIGIFFLCMTAVVGTGLLLYSNWPEKTPKLSEDEQFYATLKCPENYSTEAEKEKAREKFVLYVADKVPDITMDEMMMVRANFLMNKNCDVTLQIWAENNAIREEYFAKTEREQSLQEVMGSSTSDIIFKQ